MTKLSEPIVEKLIAVASQGMCSGLGDGTPGHMCIEAIECYIRGLPNGDDSKCTDKAVRQFRIGLNDSKWSSPAARTKGMMRLAVAGTGSAGAIDSVAFATKLAEGTIRRLLPKILREIGLNAEADRCEQEGTEGSARAASAAASTAAADAARSASYAAEAASAARAAASYAASAASYAADYAAGYADDSASYAASAASAASYADAALQLAAEIAVDVLIELGAPGTKFLHLCPKGE